MRPVKVYKSLGRLGLIGMERVQISMNVRGGPSVSVQTVNAQTHGEDMIVSVAAICCTSVSMTLASVSLTTVHHV